MNRLLIPNVIMGDAWPTEDTARQTAFCYLFLRGQFAMTEKKNFVVTQLRHFCPGAKVCEKSEGLSKCVCSLRQLARAGIHMLIVYLECIS